MSENEQYTPQLCFKRDNLDNLPPLEIPEGYTLRNFADGGGEHWVRIINESFNIQYTMDDFKRIMLDDPAYSPDRIFFICNPQGLPVATASAYRSKNWASDVGYVHYVGTCPNETGKKLGYWVSLAVLHKFVVDGCSSCVLQTDDFRIPAIKTYFRLGMHPVIVDANQPERWKKIIPQIGIPEESIYFEEMLPKKD